MAVTRDKYELPIAVADGVTELANKVGAKRQTVASEISRRATGKKERTSYVKVEYTEEEWNDDL